MNKLPILNTKAIGKMENNASSSNYNVTLKQLKEYVVNEIKTEHAESLINLQDGVLTKNPIQIDDALDKLMRLTADYTSTFMEDIIDIDGNPDLSGIASGIDIHQGLAIVLLPPIHIVIGPYLLPAMEVVYVAAHDQNALNCELKREILITELINL